MLLLFHLENHTFVTITICINNNYYTYSIWTVNPQPFTAVDISAKLKKRLRVKHTRLPKYLCCKRFVRLKNYELIRAHTVKLYAWVGGHSAQLIMSKDLGRQNKWTTDTDKERKRMDHLSDLQVLTTMVVECTELCTDMSNKEASGISAWYWR